MKSCFSFLILLVSSSAFADFLFVNNVSGNPEAIYQNIEYSGHGNSCRVSGDVFSIHGYTLFDYGREMFTCNAVSRGPNQSVEFYLPGFELKRTRAVPAYKVETKNESFAIAESCSSVAVKSKFEGAEKVSKNPVCFRSTSGTLYVYFSASLDSWNGQSSDGNRTTFIEIRKFPTSQVSVYVPALDGNSEKIEAIFAL